MFQCVPEKEPALPGSLPEDDDREKQELEAMARRFEEKYVSRWNFGNAPKKNEFRLHESLFDLSPLL